MGYQIEWLDNDKRIILVTLDVIWTWDELFEAINTVHKMMVNENRKICTIWDVTNVATLPANTLKNLKRANELYNPLSWYSALVGMPRIFRPIYEVYKRVQGFKNPFGVYMYDTVNEAHQAFEKLIAEANDKDNDD